MTALRFRYTNVLLTLILLALLAVIAMLATDARGGPLDPGGAPASTDSVRLPGTPISGQTTISAPGHYYLTRNITVPGAVIVITIAASDVSLDLGGFTIRGNDAAGSWGIWVAGGGHGDITISNGTVRDFQFGLDTANGSRVRIDHIHATSNARGIQLGSNNVLSDCTSISNGETGIYAPGNEAVINNCVSSRNSGDGIAVAGDDVQVQRSTAINNTGAQIRTIGDFTGIRDNTVHGSLVLLQNGAAVVLDNTCVFGSISNPVGNEVGTNFAC